MDTLGLIVGLVIQPADTQDRVGAREVLAQVHASERGKRVEKVLADGGYSGTLVAWCRDELGWELEITKTPDAVKANKQFVPVPKRWVVERTFGWLETGRRLSKNFERTVASAESMVYIGMIRLLTKRLAS